MPRNRTALGLAAALIALGGVYGGLAIILAGHVASNVRVDGIAVGDMSSREATVTLERVLVGRALRPVHLTVQSRTVDIQPGAAGLEIDMGATVASLTGFTINPLRMWTHLTGTENQPLKLRVEHGKLTAAVTKAADVLDRPVKEGSITFADGRATQVLSVAGREVRIPETVDAVSSVWPRQQAVQAVTKVTQPRVSVAEIRRATKELAVPAMSAPVTVLAGRDTVVLQPRQYAPALSTALDGAGRLQLRVDTSTLMAAIRAAAPGVERAPVDATVAAKGYRKAPVIYAGRLVSDYGGGVSQVSTTTFNAAFFGGVRVNEHTAHSFYIARYPEGREATVSWPDVDQKWTNDTGFGILIQAHVQGANITVTLWGTKTRDIEAVKGPRRNVVRPKVIVDAHSGCVPQLPTPGFDVTVTQIFKKSGAQVKTVLFNTHYIPEDNVTCTPPVVPPVVQPPR
jgi:vancomycin resistance protein YoaR